LVLLGGGPKPGEISDIDGAILARADFSLPTIYLPTADGSISRGEALLEDYADLGGPRGEVVPILDAASANEPERYRLLAEAGIIYIGDGEAQRVVQALENSLALTAMVEAFVGGAVVVAAGGGAEALGTWYLNPNSAAGGEPGLGWLGNAVVAQRFTGARETPQLQALLQQLPGVVGVGIPEQAALALGPDGSVESWGEGEVTLVVAPLVE
jgi:cyanophycinase-like exopeptidase